jgi:hypothetical protein
MGYFETFDQDHDSLDMGVTGFDTAGYTHLHFAPATLTDDYDVDLSKIQDQFDKLKFVSAVRRALPFGGWCTRRKAEGG